MIPDPKLNATFPEILTPQFPFLPIILSQDLGKFYVEYGFAPSRSSAAPRHGPFRTPEPPPIGVVFLAANLDFRCVYANRAFYNRFQNDGLFGAPPDTLVRFMEQRKMAFWWELTEEGLYYPPVQLPNVVKRVRENNKLW